MSIIKNIKHELEEILYSKRDRIIKDLYEFIDHQERTIDGGKWLLHDIDKHHRIEIGVDLDCYNPNYKEYTILKSIFLAGDEIKLVQRWESVTSPTLDQLNMIIDIETLYLSEILGIVDYLYEMTESNQEEEL